MSYRISVNQKGFSLVEMMIVVGIIGILSTIAIPNYQRMTAKSRQAQAKSALSAIYVAEQNFHAEWRTYTYCLWQVGFRPEEGADRYYSQGYLNGAGSTCLGVPCSSHQSFTPVMCNLAAGPAWGGSTRNDATFIANRCANPGLCGAGVPESFSVWDQDRFTAGAWGSITGGPILDVWTIDQNKVIRNVRSGL